MKRMGLLALGFALTLGTIAGCEFSTRQEDCVEVNTLLHSIYRHNSSAQQSGTATNLDELWLQIEAVQKKVKDPLLVKALERLHKAGATIQALKKAQTSANSLPGHNAQNSSLKRNVLIEFNDAKNALHLGCTMYR